LIFAQKNSFTCLLLAAGSGTRFNNGFAQKPKQFWEISENFTVLEKSFEAIAPFACTVVLALPQSILKDQTVVIERLKRLAQTHDTKLLFCNGGDSRQQSVENALQLVESKYLFIHDGARPLVAKSDIETLLSKTIECKAAILAVPVSDTIKQIKLPNKMRIECIINKTLDRSQLWAAQTPQAFETQLFKEALAFAKEKNFVTTDDASLLEHFEKEVHLVQSQHPNPKITYPEDLKYVKFLCE